MHKLSVTAVAIVTGFLGLAAPTLAADRPAERPCLIVDTDVGLDDYRALAALTPHRDVRAVVVTEGISGVPGGATAISLFLASRGPTPPVLAGLASPAPPDYEWLPAARAGAERMGSFLHDAVPFGGQPGHLARDVRAATRGCGTVDVLVLGPWTSYARYAPALKNPRAVASGLSFAENHPDNFNCEYDLAACRTAPGAVFVDLPAAGGYTPTAAMVDRFEQAGMPGLLRAALRTDPPQWLETRLWDDAAALYLLAPGSFQSRGEHVEPIVAEDEFRDLVIGNINAS